MGVWRLVWLVLLFGVVSVAGPLSSSASAAALSVSGKIQLSGEVPSWTYIILDSNNSIKQVFCNGDSEGRILVAEGSMTGALVNLTPEVQAQYDQIKSGLDFHYGVIYQKPGLPPKTVEQPTVQLGGIQLKGDSKLLADIQRGDVDHFVLGRPV